MAEESKCADLLAKPAWNVWRLMGVVFITEGKGKGREVGTEQKRRNLDQK
jgi:hypothetical protein